MLTEVRVSLQIIWKFTCEILEIMAKYAAVLWYEDNSLCPVPLAKVLEPKLPVDDYQVGTIIR